MNECGGMICREIVLRKRSNKDGSRKKTDEETWLFRLEGFI
jgi:hypothetical protein